MKDADTPLVSIVTPVYNNGEYIAECIESVLAQTYTNWEYIIVDNLSTDRSGEIAEEYASRDPRIRVVHNKIFLKAVPNHNHALRQISTKSKYCKMVFADDWILARCLEEMVALAERHPSVGIVQAYTMWALTYRSPFEYALKGGGFPYPSPFVPGREVGRRIFLEDFDPVGAASSFLYRADLVRSREQFFNESNFHADKETCVELLKQSDYGFVHQILTFNRARPDSLNWIARNMYLDIGCTLNTLVSHGAEFLTKEEFDSCVKKYLARYYNFLAVSIMRGRRDKEFWRFHVGKLDEAVGFKRHRLAGAIALRVLKALLHPWQTTEKILQELRLRRNSTTEDRIDTAHLKANATELQ